LIRKIYAALAEIEESMIGTGKIDDTAIVATVSSIEERTLEIKDSLN
jgi:hypothetical protein